MTRLKAFAVHLAISLCVVSLFAALLLTLWYPGPHLELTGGFRVMLIIIAVDATVGPLLTLIVFRPGKRGLRFDLTVIAAIQLAAFLYGAGTMYLGRPLYMPFEVDRFNVVSAKHLADGVPGESVRLKPWRPGPELVSLGLPADPIARRQFLTEALFEGVDPSFRPSLYAPYPPERLDEMAAKALDVEPLIEGDPRNGQRLNRFAQDAQRSLDALWFFPVVGDVEDALAAVDPDTGAFLGYVRVDPYPGD